MTATYKLHGQQLKDAYALYKERKADYAAYEKALSIDTAINKESTAADTLDPVGCALSTHHRYHPASGEIWLYIAAGFGVLVPFLAVGRAYYPLRVPLYLPIVFATVSFVICLIGLIRKHRRRAYVTELHFFTEPGRRARNAIESTYKALIGRSDCCTKIELLKNRAVCAEYLDRQLLAAHGNVPDILAERLLAPPPQTTCQPLGDTSEEQLDYVIDQIRSLGSINIRLGPQQRRLDMLQKGFTEEEVDAVEREHTAH